MIYGLLAPGNHGSSSGERRRVYTLLDGDDDTDAPGRRVFARRAARIDL